MVEPWLGSRVLASRPMGCPHPALGLHVPTCHIWSGLHPQSAGYEERARLCSVLDQPHSSWFLPWKLHFFNYRTWVVFVTLVSQGYSKQPSGALEMWNVGCSWASWCALSLGKEELSSQCQLCPGFHPARQG